MTMKIKLGDILMANASWVKLSKLNFPPMTAYKLMKYAKGIADEFQIIDNERVKIVLRVADAPEDTPPEQIRIERGSPEFEKFEKEFGEFLEAPSDIAPMQMSLDSLISLLRGNDNLLSVEDLQLLEPFFSVEEKTS